MRALRSFVAVAIVFLISSGCHHAPSTVQPASTPSATTSPRQRPTFTEMDVEFMQGMIGHHTQAIEMVKLLKTRTQNTDMQLLGHRIEVSQTDEIKMMRTWLADRKQSVPDDSDYQMMMSMPEHAMPGMLSQKEMDTLAAARGADFDRLFLEYMIKHHAGALTMVDKLTASGGGQESSVFAFASDVQADQSTEIRRMRAMRAAMGK